MDTKVLSDGSSQETRDKREHPHLQEYYTLHIIFRYDGLVPKDGIVLALFLKKLLKCLFLHIDSGIFI